MEKLIKLALVAFTELKFANRDPGKFPAAAACAMFGFVTAIGAVGCGVASLWYFLAPRIGEAGAALWSAVLLLVITAGFLFAAALGFRSHEPAEVSPLLEDLMGELKHGLGNNKVSVLLSALLAGLVFGNMSRK